MDPLAMQRQRVSAQKETGAARAPGQRLIRALFTRELSLDDSQAQMTGSLKLRDYPGDMARYPATMPGPNRRATQRSYSHRHAIGGANFKVPLTSAGRTGRRRDCQVAGSPAYFRPAGSAA